MSSLRLAIKLSLQEEANNINDPTTKNSANKGKKSIKGSKRTAQSSPVSVTSIPKAKASNRRNNKKSPCPTTSTNSQIASLKAERGKGNLSSSKSPAASASKQPKPKIRIRLSIKKQGTNSDCVQNYTKPSVAEGTKKQEDIDTRTIIHKKQSTSTQTLQHQSICKLPSATTAQQKTYSMGARTTTTHSHNSSRVEGVVGNITSSTNDESSRATVSSSSTVATSKFAGQKNIQPSIPPPNSNKQSNSYSSATTQINSVLPPRKITSSASIPPTATMLYVGITLERPETVNFWGLVFTKEKSSHAQINRVTPPTAEGPKVAWSRISQVAPSPALVYRTATTPVTPLDQYESNLAQHFPESCDDIRLRDTGLLVPYVLPGDAIISVNGIPLSAFKTTTQFATYIREQCQRKMILVALRHENVFKAAQKVIETVPKAVGGDTGQDIQSTMGQNVGTQEMTALIATVVKNAWKQISEGSTNNHQKAKRKSSHSTIYAKRPKIAYTNCAFQDGNGNPILYCDNDDSDEEEDPDEGKRISSFVNDEIDKSFHQWLKKRKATWREARPGKYVRYIIDDSDDIYEEGELTVQHDFWLVSGYQSFDQWLAASKTKWTRRYSWHEERRNALQLDCEREVHFPTITSTVDKRTVVNQFESWLGVRKQQWRLERRKRQRHHLERSFAEQDELALASAGADSSGHLHPENNNPNPSSCAVTTNEDRYIDEILENEERRTNETATLQPIPMDITWMFDASLGAPDDAILNIMTYLSPSDHGNLLCLSYTSNACFKLRSEMWKALCPSHWTLPRRPRKSFAALYITKIREEEEASRKRSDDLLLKASTIIEKGDQLIKFKQLITKAEKNFQFSINYTSGVVLERNSLLNLAVIEQRHKITKWLIEEKAADIEACDRGQFTPLMNAAWAGDKYMVRYLLAKGCDRVKVGYNHSSQGLAPPTFEGLNAEGWARKRKYVEVAELIRLGL